MKKVFIIALSAALSASAFAAMFDTIDVGVTVGAGSGSYLAVEPASISFGTVNPLLQRNRFICLTGQKCIRSLGPQYFH